MTSTLLLWLAAYALHSTLFLAGAWLIDRVWTTATPALRSAFWRTALLAGIATATLQTGGLVNPVAGRIAIAVAPGETPASSETRALKDAAIPPAAVFANPQPPSIDLAETPETASPPIVAPTSDPVIAPSSGINLPQLGAGAILLALWAVIASVLALRAGLMWWLAHRELAGRQPVVQGPLFERIQALAQDIGLRRLPQVSFSDRIAGPFTLPNGEICVPVWARERLPQHQLDAMLAHEMAHVLHRDSLWLAIGMALGTVFFFQPLNLIARKRLAHLAELAADDWAATRAGSGRPLAECISTFVDIAHDRAHARASMRTPDFAAAMAKPKSELVERVERLLHNRYTTGALPMKSRLMIGAGALALAMVLPGLTAQAQDDQVAPAAPAAPVQPAAPAPPAPPAPEAEAALAGPALAEPSLEGAPEARPAPAAEPEPQPQPQPQPQPERHVHIDNDDNGSVRMSITSTKPFVYRLTADARGTIKLAPDGSGVTQMGSADFLDATLDRNGQTRRVRYTGEQGGVRREFWAGGQSRPWGPDADAFVAELMPILLRETGISANERVDWLLKQKGADALLAEIALIDSDAVAGRYMGRWFETATLSAPQFTRAMDLADRIDSDSQLQATLAKAYKTQNPKGRQLIQLLNAGRSIDSDSQTAGLLSVLASSALDAEDTASAYFDLARTIDSDSQMQAVLAPVASSASLSDARVGEVIALAGRDIDSDSQLAGLLHQAAARVGASDALAKAYLDAAGAINGDSQASGVLLKLSTDARLSPASWRMLLQRAGRIGSDSQKAGVLASIAPRMPRQDDVVSAYRAAAASIGSDRQRRSAEDALD